MKKIISALLAGCCLTSLTAQDVVVKTAIGCLYFPCRKAKLFHYL